MKKFLLPSIAIGPGDFIEEELEERGWSQKDLASIMNMSTKSISQIINNKQSVTIDTAKLLNKTFGQSVEYWLNLETIYRLTLKKDKQKNNSNQVELKAKIYERMPVLEMRKKGWLPDWGRDVDKLILIVKEFWGDLIKGEKIDFSFMDANLSKKFAHEFRKSEKFNKYNESYALTWLEMAKKMSSKYSLPKYDKVKLLSIIDNFDKYLEDENKINSLLKDLNEAGVRFFILSHLQSTYTDGCSFIYDGNPTIVFTKRHNRYDNFIFTIAHELGHIVKHLKNEDDYFIDSLFDSDKIGNQKSSKEIEADEFAINI